MMLNHLNQNRLIPLLSLSFLLGLSGPSPVQAASWASQPAWATASSQSQSEAPRRRPSYREERGDLSPFSPGSHNLSLDVGQVFLMGDLGQSYNDAIGTQLHYTYGVSEMFSFDSSFGFSNHSNNKLSMTTLLSGLRMNLAWYDKVIPYMLFGLGFYRPAYDVSVAGVNNAINPVLFGVHLGPGVSLELTKKVFFGASLTFHNIFSSSEILNNGSTQRVGGSFTSFFLNAGITF
jgi:hypothetical protein